MIKYNINTENSVRPEQNDLVSAAHTTASVGMRRPKRKGRTWGRLESYARPCAASGFGPSICMSTQRSPPGSSMVSPMHPAELRALVPLSLHVGILGFHLRVVLISTNLKYFWLRISRVLAVVLLGRLCTYGCRGGCWHGQQGWEQCFQQLQHSLPECGHPPGRHGLCQHPCQRDHLPCLHAVDHPCCHVYWCILVPHLTSTQCLSLAG